MDAKPAASKEVVHKQQPMQGEVEKTKESSIDEHDIVVSPLPKDSSDL